MSEQNNGRIIARILLTLSLSVNACVGAYLIRHHAPKPVVIISIDTPRELYAFANCPKGWVVDSESLDIDDIEFNYGHKPVAADLTTIKDRLHGLTCTNHGRQYGRWVRLLNLPLPWEGDHTQFSLHWVLNANSQPSTDTGIARKNQ